MWVCIILTLLTIIRTITIAYIANRLEQIEHSGIRDGMLIDFYWDFETYSHEDFLMNVFVTIITILFTTQFVILLNTKLKTFDTFKTDFLIFRPKWMLNSNLGLRRLLSLISNICVLVGIFSLFTLPICFITDFPAVLINNPQYYYSQDTTVALTISILFFSISSFWGFWALIGLLHWIIVGFKKE